MNVNNSTSSVNLTRWLDDNDMADLSPGAIRLLTQILCQNLTERGLSAAASASASVPKKSNNVDALLYIIVVLLAYAFSMIVLMVKYVQRENKEAIYDGYYVEFVKREKFNESQSGKTSLRTLVEKSLLGTKPVPSSTCKVTSV